MVRVAVDIVECFMWFGKNTEGTLQAKTYKLGISTLRTEDHIEVR